MPQLSHADGHRNCLYWQPVQVIMKYKPSFSFCWGYEIVFLLNSIFAFSGEPASQASFEYHLNIPYFNFWIVLMGFWI